VTARLTFWQRSLLTLVVAVLLALPAYRYLATHDVGRTVREFLAGERNVTWPPALKSHIQRERLDLPDDLAGRVTGGMRAPALALLAGAALVAVSRLEHRRRRTRELATFELRLGRDDVSNPYRVQEAFEAIIGALSARWYERLWCGQDHFALETHRLPDRSIRFTLAARRPLVAAIAGPLEDLYPDVRLIEQPGRPRWTACVVRLKKRHLYVLSLQTLRDYEHAFSESLVTVLGGLGATPPSSSY